MRSRLPLTERACTRAELSGVIPMPDNPPRYGTGAAAYDEDTDRLKTEAGPLTTLWSDGTLLPIGGSVTSDWFDVRSYETLHVMRATTGGTYAFEIDWSRTGANDAIDVVETIAVPDDGRAQVSVASLYARFRVRNTDAVTAMTAHRTSVHVR